MSQMCPPSGVYVNLSFVDIKTTPATAYKNSSIQPSINIHFLIDSAKLTQLIKDVLLECTYCIPYDHERNLINEVLHWLKTDGKTA